MTENESTCVMTPEQCDALAERIAAVLHERKQLGDERRRRQQEYERKNGERASARYYNLRNDCRLGDMYVVYATIMSSNAAL